MKIGNLIVKNNIALAPMAGTSNPSYMKICEEMGVGFVVTELISAEAVVRNNKKTMDMLKGIDKLSIPTGIQLFGANAEVLSNAALIITSAYKNAFIDINMGCPVAKVALKANSGSALLKSPENVREIVEAVVSKVKVPVTVKIRSGWDENSVNAVEIAKICEEAGASLISIHARTRKQGYTGKANWSVIKSVVDAVNIPVMGNGDVCTCFDAKKMLEETGCAGVMIGRALLGNPWLIKETNEYLKNGTLPKEVSLEEKLSMMKKHIEYMYLDKNEKEATLEMRSNLMYYLKAMQNTKELKLKIVKCTNKHEYINLLDEFYENCAPNYV